jgi:hypothetical protein
MLGSPSGPSSSANTVVGGRHDCGDRVAICDRNLKLQVVTAGWLAPADISSAPALAAEFALPAVKKYVPGELYGRGAEDPEGAVGSSSHSAMMAVRLFPCPTCSNAPIGG